MSSVEYEALRARRPELQLPAWRQLTNTQRHKARRLFAEEVAASRVAILLSRSPGVVDKLRGRNPWRGPYLMQSAFARGRE